MSIPTIALAGNPNCGKTTLFNTLTGGKQKTGNWPGVTVEKIEGDYTYGEEKVHVVDLPGIYSLSAHSEDERVSRDYILSGEADLVVNIVDSTNIERNLYLTTHLLEMNVPMIVVLNMRDMAANRDITIHVEKIAQGLNVPVLFVTAVKKGDALQVQEAIAQALKKPTAPAVSLQYENEVEEAIAQLQPLVEPTATKLSANSRWLAIKVLEGDLQLEQATYDGSPLDAEQLNTIRAGAEKKIGDEVDIVIADGRYGFIHSVVTTAVRHGAPQKSITDAIDRIVLNRFLGLPIFMAVMYFTFWLTINVGGAFIDFFDGFFGTIFVDGTAALLGAIHAPQWLVALVATGLGGGVQTIATFVPIIFMLYFILSVLEDSGYMARGAFVMDRLMRFVGLPGKAFIPMLVGFGCTVPAIMATRTLENKRDRYLTIFMAPFMSCGARLPVYALFAAAFFPNNGQNIVFLLYLIGIVLAVVTGILLKKTLFAGESAPFVMELPVYHTPRFKHIFIHTTEKLKGFVVKAGKVLMVIVTILGFFNSLGTDGSFGNEDSENSVLAMAGKSVTPLFSSFGVEEDNWPAAVGLFTGLFAKEVVVGTLNSLYSQVADAPEEEPPFSLGDGLKESFASIPANLAGLFDLGALTDPLGLDIGDASDESAYSEELEVEPTVFKEMRKRFSKGPLQAFAYLLFVLLYVPCLVAVSAAYKEVGAKLTIFQVYYSTMLAWVIATLFYQITLGHSAAWILSALIVGVGSIGALFMYAQKMQK